MKKHKHNFIKVAILTLGISGVFGASSASASTTYEIKKGDTLYSLAKKYNTSVSQLKFINHLTSNTIIVGKKLVWIVNTKLDNIFKVSKFKFNWAKIA
ncbi:LysM peptidoglycan-binding domain-containing protein [Metabacillus sp. B2-18]|uniref:LysM peptidoglycan-binding domain-containing protein n=1 Tax=Metabacillus sp. B2-18 TaxID=2897333 RepID=UPI001E5ECAFC|nr:LysM peptidoglycan-binding domain-containing protein [Metabacillus sp. B2-18]UGB29999.1 LysM peptidoglycan-binding domain-containing protein [Metabacillus sp. B2-18]